MSDEQGDRICLAAGIAAIVIMLAITVATISAIVEYANAF
jgi:hypothetical protein